MNLQAALALEPNYRLAFFAAVFAPSESYMFSANQFFAYCKQKITLKAQRKFNDDISSFFTDYPVGDYWINRFSTPSVFFRCCQSITESEISTLERFHNASGLHHTGKNNIYQHYWNFIRGIKAHFKGQEVNTDDLREIFDQARFLIEKRWLHYLDFFVKNEDYHWLAQFNDGDNIRLIWSEFLEQYSICQRIGTIDSVRKFFESSSAATNVLDIEEVKNWFILNCDFIYKGFDEKALQSLSTKYPYYYTYYALYLMKQGRHAEALASMEQELKLFGNKRLFNQSFTNLIYAICLFNNRSNPKIYKRMEGFANRNLKGVGQELIKVICHVGTNRDVLTYDPSVCSEDSDFQNLRAIVYCYFGIFNYSMREETLEVGKDIATNFMKFLVACVVKKEAVINELKESFNFPDILPTFTPIAPWERALDRLLQSPILNQKPVTSNADVANQERVIYWVDMNNLEVQPRLIKSKNGIEWSKGRSISLLTFSEGNFSNNVTPQDLRVIKTMRQSSAHSFDLGGVRTLYELIGHPYVYRLDQPDQEVRVVEVPLQLEVKKNSKGWQITHNVPQLKHFEEFQLVGVHGNVISILRLKEEQYELIQTLTSVDTFPENSESKLTQVVGKLSRQMMVMGELVENTNTLNKVKGDTDITFQFSPRDNDLFAIQAMVCPLDQSALTCEPGNGLEYIGTQVNGVGVQVQRDLKKEKEHMSALAAILSEFDESLVKQNFWNVDTLGCLRFLEVLRDAPHIKIVWPEGVRMKVSYPRLSASNIHMSLHRMNQWFEVAGHINIDGKTQMSIAELLAKVRESKGQYIPLDNDEYLAVTDNLRKHLSALENVVNSNKKASTISVYNSGIVHELEKSGVEIEAETGWRDLVEKINQAQNFTPVVPKNLAAELRDYQVDGFDWLMRLSQWGAGGCLSDDMGLGKTLQTIAMLLARANQGPALVVVPTSVLYNWCSELARFAPSLNIKVMKLADRENLIKEAKNNDVVLVTYGVLVSEEELMSQKNWSTVVLDEAHVIKNRDTKMAKACRSLQADFRVLLTGTPIQNNLSEIWSLFEFANPGLLGTFKQFTNRFIVPIERDQNKDTQRLLKRILSPFILRRTKSEVLDELPQKTDVTIKIQLSEKERALYEHLRLETTTSLDLGEINPIQALSALTKLRQAACHPKLVDSKLNIESSKTERFLELVEDLQGNNHRALVFSQFTSHLDLIKKELDAKGISYLYLDGSMSANERLRLVDNFQNGNQLLFLISLKAGGTGLNLTAADYVIHLDPWWNPAIESQASDRAYRIGQQRPVTIYRLIAENTVEERIIELHKTKKSLADALMEGADMANKLSKDEILKLLTMA